MNLSRYIDSLRQQLAIAADAGGDDARKLAERLTAPLESAVRLVMLEVLSAAADEITRELAPGSVEVRLRGSDPGFVVTLPAAEDVFDDADSAAVPGSSGTVRATGGLGEGDESGTSRLNLRLPEGLKLRIEEAARQEGLSLNAWLVRTAAAALGPNTQAQQAPRRSARGGQRYTGWVR